MIETVIERGRVMEKFGAARLRVVGESFEVSPEHGVFEEMVDGWRAQRLARNLAVATVESGARVVRRFCDEVGRYPWQWTPADLENWVAVSRHVIPSLGRFSVT
jgi:integrase/recombinase XerC